MATRSRGTSSARRFELTAAEVVEVFAARFRQEDGFRDHKQRLGMEECRAWTKEPILRTFTVQMAAQTLLRLLQFELDAEEGAKTWQTARMGIRTRSIRRFWICVGCCGSIASSHFLAELEEMRKVQADPAHFLGSAAYCGVENARRRSETTELRGTRSCNATPGV